MRARRTTSPTGTHRRGVRITVAAVAVALVGGCSAAEPSTAASPATGSTKTTSSSAAPETDLSGVYRAEVDPQSLGLFVTALVSVTPLDPKQPDDLPERVQEFAEVEDCHSVAGDENYILKVRTRTTAGLEDLLRRLREKAGVHTRTTIVLSTPFERRPVTP